MPLPVHRFSKDTNETSAFSFSFPCFKISISRGQASAPRIRSLPPVIQTDSLPVAKVVSDADILAKDLKVVPVATPVQEKLSSPAYFPILHPALAKVKFGW